MHRTEPAVTTEVSLATWLRSLVQALQAEGQLLRHIETILLRQRDAMAGESLEELQDAFRSGQRILGTIRRRRTVLQFLSGVDQEVLPVDATSDVGGASVPRVLIAEDDEVSATILMHRLKKEGLDVVRYDDGQQACDAALASPPDLVILDIKMPGLDGFEVLQGLRSDKRFGGIPIIMLTAKGQDADVVRGFRLGADDYIRKPFSTTELSARVRRLLGRARSSAEV